MSLTPEQELDMYSDIKVIKNNCLKCAECQKEHSERISTLEKEVSILKEDKKWTGWVCSIIGAVVAWVLNTLISFFKG